MNSDEKHCTYMLTMLHGKNMFFGGPNMDALCQNTLLLLASSKEEISTAPVNYIKLKFNNMLQSQGNKDRITA